MCDKSFRNQFKIDGNSIIPTYPLINNRSFSQLTIFSNQDSFSLEIPAFKILTRKNRIETKFLCYAKTESQYEKFFKVAKQSLDSTQIILENSFWSRNDFVVSKHYMNIDFCQQEAFMTCEIPREAHWARHALSSVPLEITPGLLVIQENTICKRVKTYEGYNIRDIERTLGNYLMKFERLDRSIFMNIYTELKQNNKNCSIVDNTIQFLDVNVSLQYFRKYKVVIYVKNGVVGMKFYMEPEARDKNNFKTLGFENLKKYFASVNGLLQAGNFSCDKDKKQVWYSNNYHAVYPGECNQYTLFFIQKSLLIYSLHLGNIQKILQTNTPIEAIISNGKLIKCPKPKLPSQIFKTLTETQISSEKLIIQHLNESRDMFFVSRFSHKSIQFKPNNQVIYTFPQGGESFLEVCTELAKETLSSIIELAEELTKKSLYFIKNAFPIKHFVWISEKPTFTYPVLLSEILEIREKENKRKYMKEFLENLGMVVAKIQNEKVTNLFPVQNFDVVCGLYENAKFIEENQHTANIRYALFQDNNHEFMVKYHGLTRVNNKIALIATESFSQPAIYNIFLDKPESLLLNLHQILNMISEVQSKNTEICAFDDRCIGYFENKMKWLILTNQQVKESFKAPEVVNGRYHKSSLIYSFGKYVLEILKIKFSNETMILDSIYSTNQNDELWLKEYLQTYPINSKFFEETLNTNKLKRPSLARVKELLDRMDFTDKTI
ncbi:hypothetical protein SteCoe_33661 [Stentor coeruleus]|uniref:Protein kinase domain-containing protein n=1 Tax=Stentor coeruleus TaxID=5963 RepID=A0A1R2AW88_9CILI|nr:hypothetical protein SteCoe_33661 [Stentor coeruleus]